MIKILHHKTVAAAFMLLLCLITSFAGAVGTHLCFGEDGHVTVELVDACTVSGLGAQHAGMEDDACGPCQDVTFSSDAHISSSRCCMQTSPLLSSVPIAPSLPSHDYPVGQVHPSDCSHHKTLASLQSVVLLI
jgi:hypothetical protein